jgi:hypothetical protein
MSANCYVTGLSQRTTVIGHCVQSAIQHVIRTPRLAEGSEWATSLISVGLAISCALFLAVALIAIENRRPVRRRRFT